MLLPALTAAALALALPPAVMFLLNSFRYRPAPEVERAALGLEATYHRLVLAIVGLSGYSLLCLGYMVFHARAGV